MPDNEAKIADVYHVRRAAVVDSSDPKAGRPMICVAELPLDTAIWRAMPRLTHGQTDDDLPSDANSALRLSEPGWWSRRFIHSVRKSLTGGHDCSFKGHMEEPEKTRVLDHYRQRPRPAAK